jgi:hypothetical protein
MPIILSLRTGATVNNLYKRSQMKTHKQIFITIIDKFPEDKLGSNPMNELSIIGVKTLLVGGGFIDYVIAECTDKQIEQIKELWWVDECVEDNELIRTYLQHKNKENKND